MGDLKLLTVKGRAAAHALAHHTWRLMGAAWAASAHGPWRAMLGVLLAFGLPLLALAAVPIQPGVERWQRVEGLAASGAVRQVVAGQRDGKVSWYAVVEDWGAYRSSDGGRNWHQVDRHLPRGRWGQALLGPLALAADDPGLLLVAIAGPATGGQPAIFKSIDGGDTWLPRRGLGACDVHALAVAPGPLVYAATQDRLYRSRDSGDTWLEAGRRPVASRVLAMAVDPASGALYIGSEGSGLWLTSDRGASWWAILDGHTIYDIAIGAGTRVYAGTEQGLHTSTNGGFTWRAIDAPAQGPVVAVDVAPGSPDRIFAATAHGPLQYSPDGGATWQSLSHTLLQDPVTALAVDPASARRVYVGTQRGLWHCTLPAEVQHGHDDQ